MWLLFAARSFDINMPKRRLMFIIFAFISVHWLRILTTNNDWMWLEVLKFTCSASLRATSSRPSRTDLPSRLSISRVLNEKYQTRRRQSLHTCDLPNSWWKTFDTKAPVPSYLWSTKFLMKNLSYKPARQRTPLQACEKSWQASGDVPRPPDSWSPPPLYDVPPLQPAEDIIKCCHNLAGNGSQKEKNISPPRSTWPAWSPPSSCWSPPPQDNQ